VHLVSTCAAAQKLPPPGWTAPSESVDSVFTPTGRDLGSSSISIIWQALSSDSTGTDLGALHNIGAPIHIYPLYENAFRAHRGQSLKANNEESAKLYAQFSEVAEKQLYAWNYGRRTDVKTIGTVSEKNRMICFPCECGVLIWFLRDSLADVFLDPLLMNAFNTVNLSAACILTSTSHARALGIPESKWIYPLSGAGTKDADEFWLRPNYFTSPSISRSLDAALELAGLDGPSIDLLDIYSCFPIVPKLAAHHLGLPVIDGDKSLTLLGGLTSFGGAGNNYSMHALTEMVRALRQGRGRNGLVLCNGGVLSYQHVVVLSKEHRGGHVYPQANPLPKQITDEKVPCIAEQAEGEAFIEVCYYFLPCLTYNVT